MPVTSGPSRLVLRRESSLPQRLSGNTRFLVPCRLAADRRQSPLRQRRFAVFTPGGIVISSGSVKTQMIGIIGGSGFIGTRLARRLSARNDPFRVLDKNVEGAFRDRAVRVDVRRNDALRAVLLDSDEGAFDTVINLAAEHRDDVRPTSLYEEVNVRGAENVCVAAEAAGVRRIIFTSTVAVYGFAPVGTDESGPINPFNEYGRTKAKAEEVYRRWQSADPDRSLVIVRPTAVFGEGNRGNIYNLFRQIASDRFVMVGSGTNRKSIAYVENVAAFLESQTRAAPGVAVYNYVDKPDYSMIDLVAEIDGALGRARRQRPRMPYALGMLGGYAFDVLSAVTGHQYAVSSVRVRKFAADTVFTSNTLPHTGFVPPVSLRDAIRRTIRYEFLENHSGEQTYQTE